MHLTGSAERDQCHRHLDPRFEAHRGTGGDVEASPPRLIAIDVERRIGLREVDMTATWTGRSPVLVTVRVIAELPR